MNVGDVLSRSIDNVIANWEAVLLEFGALALVSVGLVLGRRRSGAISLLENVNLHQPDVARIAATVIVTVIVGGLIWIAVMAFPIAANARLYVDGARAAAASSERTRAAYRAFSLPAWLAAAGRMWARVLGIQFVAAACAAIVIGVPFLLLFALPRMLGGCLALLLVFPLTIAAVVLALLCTRKAIVVAAARDTGVGESLRIAWREIMSRFAAHFLPLLVIGILTLAASFAFGMVAVVAKAITGPMAYVHILGSILRSAPAAAGSCWMFAAFASLTEER